MRASGLDEMRRGTAGAARMAIDVAGLTKVYWTTAGTALHALDDVDLMVHAGEFLSIVGPSGCGKSTLLKLVAGLLPIDHGSIKIDGEPVTRPRATVAVVPQQPVLLPWLTVLGNVLLPIEARGLDLRMHRPKALELLALTGLTGFERAYPYELSGGMQQRASISRALIADPAILLMDEPFGALDAITRDQMNLELQRIWQASRKTVLFVTHSISEAVFLSDRVLVMSARPGRVIDSVHVPFDRPRRFEISAEPEFARLVNQLRSGLGGRGAIQ
jgi:NitT/TauT family transport system ATP-binding protein